MDESGTGETLLPLPMDVGEGSITTYEVARAFFTSIHGGAFKDTFTRLFPTPSALLDPGNLWEVFQLHGSLRRI
jgi:hypothetical protein